MIEITEVTPKMAYGRVISTTVKDLSQEFKPKEFIIRSIPERSRNKKSKKKQENMRKEIEKEFDESW